MYRLPQAGILANTHLKQHLKKYGYTPAAQMPDLFTHETRPITFALIVNDFGVKSLQSPCRERASIIYTTSASTRDATH